MQKLPIDRGRHAEIGLTLLEVLAAAMIFAMVMTVLIGTSSTAVHNIGVSARRLEADLVADEVLADLEIQMHQGIAPEIAENEIIRDQFSIRVFQTALGQTPSSVQDAGPGSAANDITALLGTELPEVAKHLKQYDIEVGWIEQNGPQKVTRTTFAFDWQAAAAEFGELFQGAGEGLGQALGAGGNDASGNSGGASGAGSSGTGSGTGKNSSSRRGGGSRTGRNTGTSDGGFPVAPGRNIDLSRPRSGRSQGPTR